MSAVPTQPQTALHHIHELRRRILACVVVMGIGAGLAYGVRGQIIEYLQHPLARQLFYTSPTGSFQFVMQVCLLGGVLLALPFIAYHLLRFIEPALPKRLPRRLVFSVITGSLCLALAGVAFAYYVSLPAALRFFNSVGTSSLHPLITIDQYFSFVLGYLATFAIVFQLPLVILFINHIKPLGPGGMSRWRKWVVIASFGIALVMPSAPDPLSQVILALPIILLYEVSILLVRITNLKRRRKTVPKPPAMAQTPAPAPAPRPHRSPEPQVVADQPPARLRHRHPAGVIDLSAAPSTLRPSRVPSVNVLDLRQNGA